MKRLIVIVLCIALALVMCGCTIDERSDESITEWVSPDGVHYWVWVGYRKGAMVPRYDNQGRIIIDEVSE